MKFHGSNPSSFNESELSAGGSDLTSRVSKGKAIIIQNSHVFKKFWRKKFVFVKMKSCHHKFN